MYLLTTFGGIGLESDGDPLRQSAVQRRRLALLVLLARRGDAGMSREKLLGLLWPDSSTDDARHALDQLVYATRRDLSRDAVTGEAGQLRLNGDVVRADCAEFDALLRTGDLEGAVALYAGPFLDSVYLGDGGALERWVESERRQLEEDYARALERLANDAAARSDSGAAAGWWRRRAAVDPFSARVALRLMEALAANGDAAAAIQHGRTYAVLVRDELRVEPDPEVAALAHRLTAGSEFAPASEILESAQTRAAPEAPAADAHSSAGPRLTWSRERNPAGGQPVGLRTDRTGTFRSPGRLAAVATLTAVLLAGGAFWTVEAPAPQSPAAGVGSVAVLPFVDLGGDGSAEYLGDGMSEELIHALAQMADLKVVARTSAFAFKGEHVDVREIARALGVEAVLEGSVRRVGGELRVTAQLIDAATGYHLWSGSFDRSIGDALAIQHEIAASIVATIRPHLAGGVRPAQPSRLPAAGAYHLFLRGRYAAHQGTEPGLREAVVLYEEAIRADPSYAAAYAALADAHDALGDAGFAPQDSSYTLAEAAAERAIQLDSTLAEAYAARGELRFHRWDWPAAERDYGRAIELNPGHAATYGRYAMLLVMAGRFDEGLAMIRAAQQMDPLALGTHGRAGWLLTLSRRYDEAIDQLRTVVALDSMRDATNARLGVALVLNGESAAGIAALERAVELGGGYLRSSLPLLGFAYASAGRHADAETILRRVERDLPHGSINPYYAAALAGALGHRDRAFALLERTFHTSKGCLIDLGVDPLMDPLRDDPRYLTLARDLGMRPRTRGAAVPAIARR